MTPEPIELLIARGEEQGYLLLSEIELAAGELDPEELEALYVQLEAYGIEVRDDCGREEPGEVTYANGDLAAATADSLSSFSTRCPATPC